MLRSIVINSPGNPWSQFGGRIGRLRWEGWFGSTIPGGPRLLSLTLREAQLSPRDRATRRVNWTVRNVAQMFVELHLISPATRERHSKSLEMAAIDRIYDTSCYWCVVTTCISYSFYARKLEKQGRACALGNRPRGWTVHATAIKWKIN